MSPEIKKMFNFSMKHELPAKRYYYLTVIMGIVSILFNITISALNYFKIAKHPPIYGIERLDYYDIDKVIFDEINKKLSSGKYTLLYTRDLNVSTPHGDKHVIILGKIQK